jgi:hypothetical protein
MFLTELSPLVQELTQQPVAFLGGLMTGLLRLNLADDPIKSWLDSQLGAAPLSTLANAASPNGKNGPQSINID